MTLKENPFISQLIAANPEETSVLVKAEFDRFKENKEWEKIDEVLAWEEFAADFYISVILLDETFDIRKELKNRKRLVDEFSKRMG